MKSAIKILEANENFDWFEIQLTSTNSPTMLQFYGHIKHEIFRIKR